MHLYDKFFQITDNKKMEDFPIFEIDADFQDKFDKATDDNLHIQMWDLVLGKNGSNIFDKMCFHIDEGDNKDLFFIDYAHDFVCIFSRQKAKDNIYVYCRFIFEIKENEHKCSNPACSQGIINLKHVSYFDENMNTLRYENSLEFLEERRELAETILHIVCGRVAFSIKEINSAKEKFVMEVIPKKHNKEKVNKKYNKKNKYRMISAVNFIKLTKENNVIEEHERKMCEHMRRGHYRTFTAERYVNKKGERIWVDAIWVGDSEATTKGIKYKIRLDL